MAENYVVNYDINVRAQQGLESIRKFQEATLKLDECGRKLMTFQKKVESVSAKFSQMVKKAPVFDIATSKASKKLDAVIVKLEKIHRLAKKTAVLNVSAGATAGGKGGRTPSSTPAVPVAKPSSVRKSMVPKNIGYRNLGPTMIDSGGIGAFDMVKGMGIAYGISGLGSLMGNVLREATEYDNIIKTTENILKTHDKLPGFTRRFKEMEKIVRNVGVETKFTAPQVADASKFLAMAGFDIEGVNKSIRPISDIALVGDTDLGETADVVTNIMTGYSIKPEKMRRAADIMTMTFTKTNTTLMDIAEAYKYSASLLSAGGVSFEEATAGLGILGDAGIKGSQAGTTFRTIMANIVNPTKKQQAQWDEVGVQRLDKDGKVRPLIDIFQDLNQKDMGISGFYKMFHKTAAQGAVSLANNVDKWNEVVYRNFLSDGLVYKLAEEKKNTIQGLWDQLTSAFTEDGMVVFEELQRPLKDMMKQTISWINTPEAIQTIRDLSINLFDLVKMLKDFGVFCVKAYNSMSWFIQPWLKFQIVMWPILSFFRAFKALGNFGMYVVSMAGSITRLAGSFMGLFDSIKQIRQAGVIKTIKALFVGTASNARANTAETIAEMVGIPANKPFTVIKGGGADPKQIVKTTSSGGRFLSVLPWLGAAAAVGTLAYGIYNVYSHLQDLSKAYDNWYEKVYATKGYLSEGLSTSEKYLKLVYDKQLSVNEKVEEYIRLRREEMGLTSQAVSDMSGKPVKETYKDMFDSMDDLPWYTFLLSGAKMATMWEKGKEPLAHLPEGIRKQYNYESWSGPNGTNNSAITKNGQIYNTNKFTSDMFAATIGYDYPQAKEIIEEFTATLKQSPIEKWGDVYNRLNARLQKYKEQVNPAYSDLSLSEIGELPSNDILKIPLAFEAFNDRIREAMFNFGGDNENAKMLSSLRDLLGSSGEWSTAQQAKFLFESGVGMFGNKSNFLPGTPEWEKQFGFDRKNNKFIDYDSYSSQYWASTFSAAMSQAVDIINSLGTEAKGKFNIQSTPMAIAAWGQSQLNSGEPEVGSRQYVNGKLSEYGMNYVTGKYEWTPVKDQAPLNPDGSKNPGGGATGADQSKYKSHYQSGSAAPKQIIVKIENLMNVKSIDLTNPDNVAVIENVRGQLTQALIDVVHDFDDTFHG